MAVAVSEAAAGDPWKSRGWAAWFVGEVEGGRDAHCAGIGRSRDSEYLTFRCTFGRRGGRFQAIVHSIDRVSWLESLRDPPRVIAQKGGSGRHASVAVSGGENKPGLIEVRVRAQPDQAVRVDWSAVCVTGKLTRSRSGQRTLYDYEDLMVGSESQPLPTPSRHGLPDHCTFAASALLEHGSGSVRLWIDDVPGVAPPARRR